MKNENEKKHKSKIIKCRHRSFMFKVFLFKKYNNTTYLKNIIILPYYNLKYSTNSLI